MDIKALSLLAKQKQAVNKLSKLSNPKLTFKKYEETVRTGMSKTEKEIGKVLKYAEDICKELQAVREEVNKCSKAISKKLEELLNNLLLKDRTQPPNFGHPNPMNTTTYNSGTNRYSTDENRSSADKAETTADKDKTSADKAAIIRRENFDKKKIEQIQILQQLAKQQQELMNFVAKTEDMILKIEEESNLSFDAWTDVNNSLQQWTKALETVEEQKKKLQKEKEEEEQRKKGEMERMKQEAEENRKREEERRKRQKEEEERKKEEQRKRDEERRKREKEQEEREQEEQRKREEERRKKEEERKKMEKEREEREKEERRKREEEENRRRDWKNWTPFIFKNAETNHFEQDICCVMYTMPNRISQDDIVCIGSDENEALDKCLETNDEQVLSAVITITPQKNRKITFELPVRVYIPIVRHDAKLVPSIKFSVEGKKWKHGMNLPEIHLQDFPNVDFVGVEIPIQQLSHVQCVAIASYEKDVIEVDEKGKTFEPRVDRNIKVNIPAKTFPGKTTVTTQSFPWTKHDLLNASKRHKELENITPTGRLIHIDCENITQADSEIQMFDLRWDGGKDIQTEISVFQETLNRCSVWLVNNMNPDVNDLLLKVFDKDFLNEIKSKENTGDKNRLILRELQKLSKNEYDRFVQMLESTQSHVACRIKDVEAQVALLRQSKDEKETQAQVASQNKAAQVALSEDNFGSDFDPDFEKKEGSLRVVSKMTGKPWEVVQLKASNEHPKGRLIKLPAGNDKYQVIAFVVPDEMSDEDICKAAEILENLHSVTNVSVLCRQKHTNPHDVFIGVALAENISDTIKHLDELGYNKGPAESTSFGVVDGEEIVIKFEGNLYLEQYKSSPLKMKFYRNLPNTRISDHLAVLSKADQLDSEHYHGHLTFDVSPGRISLQRKGSMVLYVPKTMEELIGKFAFTLDVPVKALAKFIAWQLTRDNFNSTKWVRLGGYLTDCDSSTYQQIVKQIDTERPKAPQRERCENFIIHWSLNYAHTVSDKVEKIIAAHHDSSLESDAYQFIRAYTSGTGIFSNDSLEKIAFVILENWEVLAEKLGCSNDEINQIKSMHGFKVKQGLQMLDWWRLSDQAIQKGDGLVKSFHDAAKAAQLGAKLLTLVSTHM